MAVIYDLADTWNAGATTFTAIKMNVTDTDSASGSLLMDLQVGGASKFSVDKAGLLKARKVWTLSDEPFTSETFALGSADGTSIKGVDSSGQLGFSVGTKFYLGNKNSAFEMNTAVVLGWSASPGSGHSSAILSGDLYLARDAADTLAQRRTTNAQTFNLYKTYTDTGNYERGFMKWNSDVLEFGADGLGTGAATPRVVRFMTQNAAASDQPQFKLAGYDTGIALGGNDDVFVVCNGIVNASFQNSGADRLVVWNGAGTVGFSVGEATSAPDTSFSRSAAGVMGVRANNTTTGGSLEFIEQTAPAAGSATSARIFAQDNGSGKTQLMVQFGSGAAQQIAIEP